MGKRLVDQRNRFGIRKLSVGVCSVVVATCFLGVTTSYAEEQAERSETRVKNGLKRAMSITKERRRKL